MASRLHSVLQYGAELSHAQKERPLMRMKVIFISLLGSIQSSGADT